MSLEKDKVSVGSEVFSPRKRRLEKIVNNSEKSGGKASKNGASSKKTQMQGKYDNSGVEDVRLGTEIVRPDWESDELAKDFCGVGGLSDREIDLKVLEVHSTIQNYIASLGYGERRKRFGGAGKESDELVEGYEFGFGSVSLCGHIPIPAHGIDSNGDLYATGASGQIEVFFNGRDEVLRPPLTVKEFVYPKIREKTGISRKSVVSCNSPKCLLCSSRKAGNFTREIQWGLVNRLWRGDSYFMTTLTLRHFHKDPVRQLRALRRIFYIFDSCGAVKKAKKKYGFDWYFRHLEITLDSLFATYLSGAHPHFHILGLFFRKRVDKNGQVVEYPVPDESLVAELQEILAKAWFESTKKYYDNVEGDEGKADKNKDNILKYGVKSMLYAIDSEYKENSELSSDEWKERKESFEEHVKLVREKWETNEYVMPEQASIFKPYINDIWENDKLHFYRQLAGLGAVARYTGGASKFDVCREASQSLSKKGKRKSRVDYFTWLYECALKHEKRFDALAKSFCRSLFHVRFNTPSKLHKSIMGKEFIIFDKLSEIGLTQSELKENIESVSVFPQYIQGDRLRLDWYGFCSERFKSVHEYNGLHFTEKLNSSIDNFEKENETDIDFYCVKQIYDRACANLDQEKPLLFAGRGSSTIPAYISGSETWQSADSETFKKESYKYQNILKLCVSVCPDSLKDFLPFIKCGASSIYDFSAYDTELENAVLSAWRGGLKRRVVSSASVRRLLYPVLKDCEYEQEKEEQSAIIELFKKAGFSIHEAKRLQKGCKYSQKLFNDIFGYVEIVKDFHAYGSVADRNCLKNVSVAALKSVCGLDIGSPYKETAFFDVNGLSGWWGHGVDSAIFDTGGLFEFERVVRDNFDIKSGFAVIPDYGGMIVGEGKGDWKGYCLVVYEGILCRLLREKREREYLESYEKDCKLFAEVSAVARQSGWTQKSVNENSDYLNVVCNAVKAGASLDLVGLSLSHSKLACGFGKVARKKRLISPLERDFYAVYRNGFNFDKESAEYAITPLFSAFDYEKTGKYLVSVVNSPCVDNGSVQLALA